MRQRETKPPGEGSALAQCLSAFSKPTYFLEKDTVYLRSGLHLFLAIVFSQLAGFNNFDAQWKMTIRPDTIDNNVVPFCLPLFIKPFVASCFFYFFRGTGKKIPSSYLLTDFSCTPLVLKYNAPGECVCIHIHGCIQTVAITKRLPNLKKISDA